MAHHDVDPLLQTIQRSLDDTGVWVSPALRSQVTDENVNAMEQHVADSAQPLFVVVYPFADGDRFGGDPAELLTQLHDRSQVDGLYISAHSPDSPQFFSLEARTWGSGPQEFYVTSVAEHRHPGDLGGALVEATQLVVDGTAEQAYDAMTADQYPDDTDTDTGDTGTTGSTGSTGSPQPDDGSSDLPVGSLVGVVVAIAAMAVVWQVRRARRRTFSLPASVIEHVREAYDQRLEERAQADVLALGETIDATEMATADDQAAWQAALDHYDAAQRVLARGGGQPEVLDVVGAIVLAKRGVEAVAAAKSGESFTPTPVCFLNPLHDRPHGTSTVESGGRSVKVPLCSACRADLRSGRTPDTLDVVRGGRAVHYFDSDAEPWASTGYGALRSDLVPRLHGGR